MILACEGCGKNPHNLRVPFKKFRMDLASEYLNSNKDEEKSDPDDSDGDDKDVVLVEDADQPQTNGAQRKVAAAVEKGMDDNQLVPYFNRYLLLLREQKLQKKTYSEEQLHEYITELFHSLEYKNDESDGRLTYKFYLFI
jgi:hypothetical protein